MTGWQTLCAARNTTRIERAHPGGRPRALRGLPRARPTKSGTHAKDFVGDSVELDASEPAQLQDALRGAIESIIEPVAWADAQEREAGLLEEVRRHVKYILAATQ